MNKNSTMRLAQSSNSPNLRSIRSRLSGLVPLARRLVHVSVLALTTAHVVSCGSSGSEHPAWITRSYSTGGVSGQSSTLAVSSSAGVAGVASTGGDVPSTYNGTSLGLGDVFDPGEVYFSAQVGQTNLTPAERRNTSLFAVSDLSRMSATFDANRPLAVVRPTDGAIIYGGLTLQNELYLRRFVADGQFIQNPVETDPVIPVATCKDGETVSEWFKISPDTGDILFRCEPRRTNGWGYSYLSGTAIEWTESYSLGAIGYGGQYLVTNNAPIFVLHPDGTRSTITEGPSMASAIRARPDGFWVLDIDPITSEMARWRINFDGTIAEKVQYPPSPVPVQVYYYRYALDGFGRAVTLIQNSGTETARTVIVRFDPSAAIGEIQFDSNQHPEIDIQLTRNVFITGP